MGNSSSNPTDKTKAKPWYPETNHVEIYPKDLRMYCGSPGGAWSGHITYADFMITNRSGKRLSYQVILSDRLEGLIIGTTHTAGCLMPEQAKTLRFELANTARDQREWMHKGEKEWVAVASRGDDTIKQEDVKQWWIAHISSPPEGYVEASLEFVFLEPPSRLEENPDINCPKTVRALRRDAERKAALACNAQKKEKAKEAKKKSSSGSKGASKEKKPKEKTRIKKSTRPPSMAPTPQSTISSSARPSITKVPQATTPIFILPATTPPIAPRSRVELVNLVTPTESLYCMPKTEPSETTAPSATTPPCPPLPTTIPKPSTECPVKQPSSSPPPPPPPVANKVPKSPPSVFLLTEFEAPASRRAGLSVRGTPKLIQPPSSDSAETDKSAEGSREKVEGPKSAEVIGSGSDGNQKAIKAQQPPSSDDSTRTPKMQEMPGAAPATAK